MNIYNFFSRDDLTLMQNNINSRAKFELAQKHKGKENRWEIRIGGGVVRKDLADDIWHGNDYLVHFNFEHQGKAGFGGKGWAVDTFPMFQSWYSFKSYIDKAMECYGCYDTEEYGQMSLF
jgi:hypothetical protein